MPTIYLIPGLGESSLARSPPGVGIVWVDPGVLLLGGTRALTLALNGVDPGPPHGEALRPVGGVPYYMTVPLHSIGLQFLPPAYSVRTFAWDWRKTIYPAGVELAQRIRDTSTPSDPCVLVGHSAGGLVARAAWTELGTTGQHALIRRIITLGTPHWGGYGSVQFFQGDSSSIEVCQYWNQTVGGSTAGLAPDITGYVSLSTLDYQLLAETWPSMYEVMPVLGAPSSAADPLRAALYDAATWPVAYRPQQTWLDYAKNVTGPWLRSAESQPPPDVLTCCVGTGRDCPTKLFGLEGFAEGQGLGGYADGDGLVAAIDGALVGSTIYRYALSHDNFLVALSLNGEVSELILQTNPVPAPPPSMPEIPVSPTYAGPIPSASIPTLVPNTGTGCAGGICSC